MKKLAVFFNDEEEKTKTELFQKITTFGKTRIERLDLDVEKDNFNFINEKDEQIRQEILNNKFHFNVFTDRNESPEENYDSKEPIKLRNDNIYENKTKNDRFNYVEPKVTNEDNQYVLPERVINIKSLESNINATRNNAILINPNVVKSENQEIFENLERNAATNSLHLLRKAEQQHSKLSMSNYKL